MPQIIVIASDTDKNNGSDLKAQIERPLKYQRGIDTVWLKFPPPGLSTYPYQWVLQTFHQLTDAIEEIINQGRPIGRMCPNIVIVDLPRDLLIKPEDLNPISTTGEPHLAVTAMLILAFPEVHWVFSLEGDAHKYGFIDGMHLLLPGDSVEKIIRLHDQGFTPLFDATGLRNLIRTQIRETKEDGKSVAPYVPVRTETAVAIDEELDYAYFNAYITYRFGFRSYVLTSFEMSEWVLHSDIQKLFARATEFYNREGDICLRHYLIALLDLYDDFVKLLCPRLNVFTFRQGQEERLARRRSWSVNKQTIEKRLIRMALANALRCGRDRIEISDVATVLLTLTGQEVQSRLTMIREDSTAITLSFEDLYLNFPDKNPELNVHLSRLQMRDEILGKLKYVPYRILCTVGHKTRDTDRKVWQENDDYLNRTHENRRHWKTIYKPGSGIFDVWKRSGMKKSLKENDGKAKGFIWPPNKMLVGEIAGGHSAPGRLLLIAERLIKRAQGVIQTAHSIPQAIYGSVLSLNAQEYLGHRTPTISLEAISLKHKLETLAECCFYGVEYNMDVESRLAEIRREMESVGEWFQSRTHSVSQLNAEIRILSELGLTFREHNQFDEEQQVLIHIRKVHRKLWFYQHHKWAWILLPLRVYLEFLLFSPVRFLLAILFWLFTLTFFYTALGHGGLNSLAGWTHGFVDAMISFIAISLPHDSKDMMKEIGILRVCMLAFSLGFIHLGIFIAHLYAMIARR